MSLPGLFALFFSLLSLLLFPTCSLHFNPFFFFKVFLVLYIMVFKSLKAIFRVHNCSKADAWMTDSNPTYSSRGLHWTLILFFLKPQPLWICYSQTSNLTPRQSTQSSTTTWQHRKQYHKQVCADPKVQRFEPSSRASMPPQAHQKHSKNVATHHYH